MSADDTCNQLLSGLSSGTRAALLRSGRSEDVNGGSVLIQGGQPTDEVHFVERGVLSVLACEHYGSPVEVGLIGPEGLAGSWLALGVEVSPYRILAQSPGSTLRMARDVFQRACADDPQLSALVRGYAQDFAAMMAETCWANTRLTIEGRVARWLLMVHDRIAADELAITHETLSRCSACAGRASPWRSTSSRGEHMIRATRGMIRILDRPKLQAAARGIRAASAQEAAPPRAGAAQAQAATAAALGRMAPPGRMGSPARA